MMPARHERRTDRKDLHRAHSENLTIMFTEMVDVIARTARLSLDQLALWHNSWVSCSGQQVRLSFRAQTKEVETVGQDHFDNAASLFGF